MEMVGDFSHSNYWAPDNWFEDWHVNGRYWSRTEDRKVKPASEWHFPCRVCTCGKPAGAGTNHHGWGLCATHEKLREYSGKKNVIADVHLTALQQRHPRYYMEVAELMEDKIQLGRKTEEETSDLQAVSNDVGAILKNFYSMVSQHDRDADQANKEALARLDEIRELLKNSKLSSPDVKSIEDRLADIETRLCCPLTETSHGRLVPMSDKTRISLVARTLPQLTRAIKDVFAIEKERWITEPNFDIWFARLLTAFEKHFGEAPYTEPGKDGAAFPIVQHIADCVRTVGDPRRGT